MKNKKSFISILCIFMAVLMVLVNLSLPVGALDDKIDADSTVQAPVNPADKIDAVLKEKMAEASPDEKIPVAIWYNDVDQEEIDVLTANKVGFTQDDIAVDYEMPSADLLSDLKAEEEGADAELQAYMARTEKQREKERKRTDDYIMTRREFSRAKYNEKSAKIIKDIAISEEDISFKSQYAPMIIANLTSFEINCFSKNMLVVSISYYEIQEPEILSFETAIESTRTNMINEGSALGLTGNISETEPVKIGIVERHAPLITNYDSSGYYTVPDNSTPEVYEGSSGINMLDYGNVVVVGDTTYDPSFDKKTHADQMIDTLTAVAPDVKIYCSNTNYINIEAMLSEGIHILSCSIGFDVMETFTSQYDYSNTDKWYDHIIAVHGITVLSAAGNSGGQLADSTYDEDGKTKIKYGPRVSSPGLAHNVITVGAYCNEYDATGSEIYYPNEFYGYTSYKNSIVSAGGANIVGCEKPDVIAPATMNDGGTSNATPFLAGIIALIYELKPSLASSPQATKAIVLASCHNKMTHHSDDGIQENIEDGITERQGAGAPDAFIMASIVSQGTYGVGRISAAATRGIRRFVVQGKVYPSAQPHNMNVSITWLRENTVDNDNSHDNTDNISYGTVFNLDLYLYRNNGLVGSSKIGSVNASDNRISSTEMAYISLPSTDDELDYEIRIQKAESYNKVVRYGYAYSTNNPYISNEEGEEGVYYIRNYYSDKYLTLNDNNETVMSNFTGKDNQKWVISGTPGNYELQPASGAVGTRINFGAQVGSNPYYKAVAGTNNLKLSITSWETDTTLEPDAHTFTMTSTGRSNILSYTSTTGVFVRSTTDPVINMYRMWVLEDINYRVGDVNMDGKIKITDVTMLQKYIADVYEFNNLIYYIGDFNQDGSVSVKDVTALNNYVGGL